MKKQLDSIQYRDNEVWKTDSKSCDLLVIRYMFTNPIEWRAAKEGLRRGLWEIHDRVRHWTWEWMALNEVKPR